jgi:hypothetical protein
MSTQVPDQDPTAAAPTPKPPRRRRKAASPGEPAAAPPPWSPLDGPPAIPDSELPPLTYPNSEQYQFRQLAEERRRVRIRNEVIFGAILLVVGLTFLVVAHNPAFVVLALIGAGAMVAYEMTVATLE